MSEDTEYLNITDAAQALGVNRRRIRELVRAGEIESITNPLDRRERLIPRREVERLSKFVNPKKEAA